MSWEVLDAKLRGCLACMCSAWMPLSIMDPRIAPLSAQVDAQLMGRSSQKAERGTKVEMVGGGGSSRCPLSALHALCKALGEDATLPLSSCLDRAWLCGASSEKGRQTGWDAVLGVLERAGSCLLLYRGLEQCLIPGSPPTPMPPSSQVHRETEVNEVSLSSGGVVSALTLWIKVLRHRA